MNPSFSNPPAEPFFLKTGLGERFCLYHAPNPGKNCRGAFIYVHPFAEEMNKSRRMAAMQARAFAAIGWGVLQIDLFGCGDSSGEFADARWDIWKDDLAAAMAWLKNNGADSINLWGLRLGALLALDFASGSGQPIDNIVLWQPVLDGESFLTQFLRLKLANEMFTKEKEKPAGTQVMRASLYAGETLEIAGYALSPALAIAIDRLKTGALAITRTPIHWLETVSEPERPIPPAAIKLAHAWEQNGTKLQVYPVPGTPFWMTQEISESAGLLSATTRLFMDREP